MRESGYQRYSQHITGLLQRNYNIKMKNIMDEETYNDIANAHNAFVKPRSHNLPRDLARKAVTLSPGQLELLRKNHPGLTHTQMRGLGRTEFTILRHFPELSIEEVRDLTPEELQARKDAIRAMRKEEGYLAQYGS